MFHNKSSESAKIADARPATVLRAFFKIKARSKITQDSDSISHLALTAAPLSHQALAELGPRGQLDPVFFLIVNAAVPFFEPKTLHSWLFAFYTAANILINLGKTLYQRNWAAEVATNHTRAARLFASFKCGQNLCFSILLGWGFLHFGINAVTLLGTMGLMAFAQAVMITLRPNVAIMRLTLACCLVPAIVASFWVGGRDGYGTSSILVIQFIFIWFQGKRENDDYLESLLQNRELMRARIKANQEGARIGDALLTNAARHTATVAERNRIAFEWHDTLLAGFSAISWQLDEAQRRQREDPANAAQTIELARTMLQHYRAEARLVIADLLYEESEPASLATLLGQHLPDAIGAAPIALRIDSSGSPSIVSPDVTRQLLRICQEAVTNAVKHARPERIDIKVKHYAPRIQVHIADNGVGFTPENASNGNHFGLRIMRQRARKLGGDLQIRSAPGCGTTIYLDVPYTADFNMTPTRILIVEDQCFSRLALHTVIDSHPDMNIVFEADTGQAGIAAFQEHSPDVTIVDLKLPDQSGIEVIKAIRRQDPLARILVLSNFEGSEYLHRATDAGAMAYLTKDSNAGELLEAIRAVRQGQSFIPPSLLHLLESRVAGNDLTARERDVLALLVLGWSNKQIADQLGIAEKTVRIHMSSIFSKLGTVNRTQAVLVALQRGFVDPQPSEKAETRAPESAGFLNLGAELE